ncbi:tripartite tricarboxylate transporter substrate binding protein [Roseomonas sp. OT10]|nr:tripartite tricarboxylate transporter substrate binding protein [Roseomonas sp. OT10]
MSKALGQPMVVENRVGAGGTIGLAAAARSAPDGYTLGFGGVGSLVHSAGTLAGRVPFDVERDFVPIGLMGSTPIVVVASAASGIRDLNDLLARARQQPGAIAYGSAGTGGALHLAGEMLQRLAKVEMVHVPYRGGAPALTDLLSGQIPIAFLDTGTVMGQRTNPALRILAVASSERFPGLPDVPTTAEQGMPGLVVELWYGIVGPRGIPDAVATRLERASQQVADDAAFHRILETAGFRPYPGGRDRFAALIHSELETWLPIIQAANIRIE